MHDKAWLGNNFCSGRRPVARFEFPPCRQPVLARMVEQLERNQKTFGLGYWVAVAAGFALALAYFAGMCALGTMC